jgi:alpha-glucosidase
MTADAPRTRRGIVRLGPATEWWQQAVFYQIYPRSFADGNGDGVGDLWGAIEKLDYLEWLGVDAVWLSPHFPSPQADFGYDVADYTGVHPEYGDLQVLDAFVAGAHERGIKVILDLVMNHSSDRHPWFEASRDPMSPYRDWYVWRIGRETSEREPTPPNNWQSAFGGPAWTYDERSAAWYYHFFLREQPDLNWRHQDVRSAMWDVVRFWLDRGVDGFRLDAIGTLFEDPQLEDHAARTTLIELVDTRFETSGGGRRRGTRWREMFRRQHDLPEVHDVMKELRRVVDAYDDRVLVGETDDLDYHGNGTDELHLVFNFPLMNLPELTPDGVRKNQRIRHRALPQGAWPCNTFGNHDADRTASRWNHDGRGRERARLTAVLVLTLPGTPSLYMGEEIGMENFLAADPATLRDPIGRWYYGEAVSELGHSPVLAAQRAARYARDRCRTPMQWDGSPNAGFSPDGIATWLPVHPNHAAGVNVADQRDDPASLLSEYRNLIQLRKTRRALLEGGYQELLPDHRAVFAFRRLHPEGDVSVYVNMTELTQQVPRSAGTVLYESAPGGGNPSELGPFGFRMVETAASRDTDG